MKVRYTPRARDDLQAIYLDQVSPSGAKSVKQTLERRIRLLGDIPFIAPATDEPGVYELRSSDTDTRSTIASRMTRSESSTSAIHPGDRQTSVGCDLQ